MVKVEQITSEQYLKLERNSLTKHEFISNCVISYANFDLSHHLVRGNLAALIWLHLKKSSNTVFQSNMRIYNVLNDNFMYPDIVVSDGKPTFREDGKMDNLTNPVLIIEILSPSTAVYDKTDKFIACKTILTLQEYALISPETPEIEIYRRETQDHWILVKENKSENNVTFTSIHFGFRLGEIYEKND
ncbi:MAG: Uma2 family endonuclease [Spirosomaceae bacterium]|jgi:Uma2 family endonuclease|nr:Uma2 family endonuclease [Spirosomataceae bacterium]